MATVAMSGADTIIIDGRNLFDLGTGDCVKLTYPNEIANVKTGKNGNSIYGFNTTGRQCEVEIMVIRGSADDKYLLGKLVNQNDNFESTVLATGEFIKKIGDGTGQVTNDTYILSGGIYTKQIEAKSNVEGSEDQSLAKYVMKFANAPRVIT